MKIILASTSPRRKELLKKIVNDFCVFGSNADESLAETDPKRLCLLLSQKKAQAVFRDHKTALVIGCDTVVCLDGEIFGKPNSEAEAKTMLARLSGKTHQVFTGTTMLAEGIFDSFVEKTDVTFRKLSRDEIESYVSLKSCFDKAGSYGVQDTDFVSSLGGSFFNVMGLPVETLSKKLQKLGIEVSKEYTKGETKSGRIQIDT